MTEEEFKDDLAAWINNELRINLYQGLLEEMNYTFGDPTTEITREDAEEFKREIDESVAFEEMMQKFIRDVRVQKSDQELVVVVNTRQLRWIRSYHQRHQDKGLYKGRKRAPHLKRKGLPSLCGFPVFVDETVETPRLDWQSDIGSLM